LYSFDPIFFFFKKKKLCLGKQALTYPPQVCF
jgi:hypothetical protein